MQMRLFTVAPDLVELIDGATEHQRALIGSELAAWALNHSSYVGLAPSSAEEAEKVLNELENEYFRLQELADSGSVSEAQVLVAFSKARAMHAYLFTFSNEVAEVAYEAIMATDDLSRAKAIAQAAVA